MNEAMKRNIVSDRNYQYKQQLNKIIPYRKVESSLDKNNNKTTTRTDSSKIETTKIYFYDSKKKSVINGLKKNVKLMNENNLFYGGYNMNLNNSNYEKINNISINHSKISYGNNTDINLIFQNKEKAKTFNRQSSNKKLKIGTNIYKNKSNQINENLKNKMEKTGGEIYKKKLLNDNIIFPNNDINKISQIKNKNNTQNLNVIHLLKNNIKRNTDSLIQIGNKEIEINGENKERANKVKTKTNSSKSKEKNKNLNYLNYTVNPNSENKFKKKIISSNSFKKNSPFIPSNNNPSNICNNGGEYFLKNRKNIDINTEFQVNQCGNTFSPEKNEILNNFNNTTSKVKLKTNNFITNIEMDKDKQFFQLTENSSILKTKSKAKIKTDNNNKKEEPEIEIKIIDSSKNDNMLFNTKMISINNNKNNINENNNYNNNLTDDNYKHKNKKNNNNIPTNFSKVKKKQNINENIIRNNTYNNNDSSFFTININNSNIDEINNNEAKHNIDKYNFGNNLHNNENINNDNIIKNNKITNVNVLKSNSNTNKNILNIPMFKDINNFKNGYINYSNCNTGNTSHNIVNNNKNFLIQKDNKKEKEKNDIKELKNQDEKILIELDEEIEQKDMDCNYIRNKKGIIKNDSIKIKNLDDIKEKEVSLDNSNSFREVSNVNEDFIEKEEVMKLFSTESPREKYFKKDKDNNPLRQSKEEDESEIIIQNSEFSVMNEYSKYNYVINNNNYICNSNIYSNSPNYNSKNNNIHANNSNNNNPNINLENIYTKDTSILSNFGIKGCKSITQAGKERTGHRKKNQDNYIIEKNVNNILGFNLFAILDGHGENGHIVSQLASKYIIKKFTNITEHYNDVESVYSFLKRKDFQNIIDIFLKIDKEIIDQKKFDISLSGSTCVLVIQLGDHIICSNIGDSRAILIYEENNKSKVYELSQDSKPDVPEEKKRINRMGGIVDKIKDENGEKAGPYRVYIKNMEQPGLAMSRSFGDKKAKTCGVIPYPDIREYNLSNNESKFMVLCSDGVWEFLSNEEVMEIGNQYYVQNNINGFCNELLKKSTEIWVKEENYMDDITILAVFF